MTTNPIGGNDKVDYSGRTVDLLLLKTVSYTPTRQRVDVDAGGDPMIVAGVEKMVQRYALSFINALGSTKFRPDHGTNMIPNVGKGLVYNMATLQASAAEANLMARTQVMVGDAGLDTPDDERLSDSVVDNLEFLRSEARVRVFVTLTTAAGKSYKYIIPVAVGVRG